MAKSNSCCPVIRVKCSRPHSQHTHPEAQMTLAQRFARYKKAKGKFLKAAGLSGTGPIHAEHEATSIVRVPKATVEKIARAAANPAATCTVTMGSKKYKGLTGQQASKKVAALKRELTRKRCIAQVK